MYIKQILAVKLDTWSSDLGSFISNDLKQLILNYQNRNIVMVIRMLLVTSRLHLQVYILKKHRLYHYMIHKIYTPKIMERMCKKWTLEKLFIKLTKECTFSVNNQFN